MTAAAESTRPAAGPGRAVRPPGASLVFVCMDADTLGGIQRVTHTVAQGLAERGYGVQVVGLHRAVHPFRYVERPLYHHHVIHRTPLGPLGRVARWRGDRVLRGLFDELPPGFVIMTSPGVVARLAELVPPRLRRIGQYHGSYEHARGSWHLGSIRRQYGKLDQAVFLSEDDAWRFTEHALLPNAYAIPNPLPTWPDAASPLTGRRVLGVGRLEGVKRFDRLISAFAAASRAVPERWELHLIGDGAERERLAAHAARHTVTDRVVFRGRVPASEMGAEYLGAAVLGMSSEHEGLPLVLGEAAAHGVPSVSFDVSGGVRAAVGDGGVLVPPADVPAFAEALTALMASPDERRRLGDAARAHAWGFHLPHVLDRWERLFSHVSR
ncbi:Glycosyltransferase involved in cell wall bisynthesis [Sinosporangium album]|uniref:Glycosyltransferase involved in cell wall bisynthesis n=1 Tax=Sinosporangium album TaxID=504805 RepID=A0A1G8D047_9ACTN|nr:glycosyltransferase [Sinosporangium album]SDH50570.1 Glycosyltransferase involved in cell wall bisynthesis [Sinosporangium album]